jgi:hypothetical protein
MLIWNEYLVSIQLIRLQPTNQPTNGGYAIRVFNHYTTEIFGWNPTNPMATKADQHLHTLNSRSEYS